jgi:hypothetical protein
MHNILITNGVLYLFKFFPLGLMVLFGQERQVPVDVLWSAHLAHFTGNCNTEEQVTT